MLRSRSLSVVFGTLLAVASSLSSSAQSSLPTWQGYGKDWLHQAISSVAGQRPRTIVWSTPVDLKPQYSGDDLLIHYGSPAITNKNTILVPVKVGDYDTFAIEARNGTTGKLIWSTYSDYTLPGHNWVPSYGITLTPNNRLVYPGLAGRVYIRTNPDSASGTTTPITFYGDANYQQAPDNYNNNLRISTPITSDKSGNLYFGYIVAPGSGLPVQSGLARISSTGQAMWVSASEAAQDAGMAKVVYNCAPALSKDGKTLYIAVNNLPYWGFGAGYLLALDSTTLQLKSKVLLKDVKYPDNNAYLPDDGTASPTVGPDGDVYFGVLENPFYSNHVRGWLLHFNSDLSKQKIPGAFGWDDTASVVPASAVPSYTGTSTYLLLTKYNNYVGGGGDGVNKVAILDPRFSMIDPISGAKVMKEVLVRPGITPDEEYVANHPDAVREWCINTAVVDPQNKCAYVNNEDGKLYRWDFTTNTLEDTLVLTPGIGEAYTPTLMGKDGMIFAINNATLFAVGAYPTLLTLPTSSYLMGASVTFSTKLTLTQTGGVLGGKNIAFLLDGVSIGRAQTDTGGTAKLTYTLPAGFVAGNHTLLVSYAGETDYAPTSTSRTVAIRYQTALSVPGVSGNRGTTVNLKATLTRVLDGVVLSGKTLSFSLNGTPLGTAITDANGVATYAYAIPATATVGKVKFTVSFAGDTANTSRSTSGNLTIK